MEDMMQMANRDGKAPLLGLRTHANLFCSQPVAVQFVFSQCLSLQRKWQKHFQILNPYKASKAILKSIAFRKNQHNILKYSSLPAFLLIWSLLGLW
jgi:hypothetical protein